MLLRHIMKMVNRFMRRSLKKVIQRGLTSIISNGVRSFTNVISEFYCLESVYEKQSQERHAKKSHEHYFRWYQKYSRWIASHNTGTPTDGNRYSTSNGKSMVPLNSVPSQVPVQAQLVYIPNHSIWSCAPIPAKPLVVVPLKAHVVVPTKARMVVPVVVPVVAPVVIPVVVFSEIAQVVVPVMVVPKKAPVCGLLGSSYIRVDLLS
eukprot:CAMPEP_0168222888 /NCGR_PEP_ID=MMETSP0140_2-20121125/10962_1 /TAXON_ID=44445 /ORGANISM="Pseudo-nitzschia australis, Strain 10249 10 AB" /LENGTH=205 /DNA_ID=CAMNT_0008152623 /DNA_START=137 /DNA_END=755 /DNA_ORIENTATION=+